VYMSLILIAESAKSITKFVIYLGYRGLDTSPRKQNTNIDAIGTKLELG